MEYVSRVPRAPLDGLIDDLYYLEGAPPYPRLTLLPSSSDSRAWRNAQARRSWR